jgi:hypothetical protein
MKYKKQFFYLLILISLLVLIFPGCNVGPINYEVCHPSCSDPKIIHKTNNIQNIEGWPGYIIYYDGDGEGYVTGYNYEIRLAR